MLYCRKHLDHREILALTVQEAYNMLPRFLNDSTLSAPRTGGESPR